MEENLLQLWQTLSAEHDSNFVELSRFLGFAKGYYNYSEDAVSYWLLDKIEEGAVINRLFLGRQYIKFNPSKFI